jgi:hypothetical protein
VCSFLRISSSFFNHSGFGKDYLPGIKPQEDPMHVQIVNFNLVGLADADFRKASSELAPAFAVVPGLISKIWLADESANTYGGVYLWRDREAMQSYAASDLFKAIATNPHFANLVSRDFDTQAGPTRITAGLLAGVLTETSAAR